MASRQKRGGSRSGKRPRILRIGVMLGDTFIEERLIREQKPVTIGQSPKNVFSIPIEGMPRTWTLFEKKDGRFVLRIHERMRGRVTAGDKRASLETLKKTEARAVDDHWEYPLPSRARGKIQLGEMKLLFQQVAAPPVQPKMRLPASIRGSLFDRVDSRLALILAISLAAHFAIAIWAFQHDQVKERHAQRRLKEFREERYKERTITMADSTEVAATTTESAASRGTAGSTASRRPGGGSAGAGGSGGPPTDEGLAEEFKNDPVLGALGYGSGGGQRYAGAGESDQGGGLEGGMEQLGSGSGDPIAGFGAGDRRSAGPAGGTTGGDRSGGGIDGPSGGGGTQPKQEDKIPSRASFRGIDEESDGTLDPNYVARKIQSHYKRGLQKCHERLLKVNPRAGGRVQLQFTIGPTGKVTSARAKGFDSGVDACISRYMRTWRFRPPKDEDDKPAQAKFSMPVMLTAGT